MGIFFTADHHFGHSNIITYHNRPFANANEMNEALIQNWNEVVNTSDTVYHLGDISVLRPERTRKILDRLHGKIFLIRGNHDYAAESEECASRFEWIKDYHFLVLNGGVQIALMHYAMRVWNKRGQGAWNFYGHSHGKLLPEEGAFALDVGIDCWNYRPVSLHTIRDKMIERGWKLRGPRPSKT